MSDVKVTVLRDVHASLGEGPSWDAHKQCLYWIDIDAGHLHVLDPKGVDSVIDVSRFGKLGVAVPAVNLQGEPTGFVIGTEKQGIVHITVGKDGKSVEKHEQIFLPNWLPKHRFNDGKVDPVGRFVVGTMDMDEKGATGSLYVLSFDGSAKEIDTKVTVSNGLAWSADGHTLYYIDSPTRQVVQHSYNLANGRLSDRKVIFTVPDGDGYPDGMSIDADGKLWVCLWQGQSILRVDPHSGQVITRLPAWNVTSCAFGGPNFDQLYVTSAGQHLEKKQPLGHDGAVFLLTNLGTCGAPQRPYILSRSTCILDQARAVLDFWFAMPTARHFTKDLVLDATIKEKFGTLLTKINCDRASSWRNHPDSLLAAVIVFDQFSRNIYRGTPEAFGNDQLALELTMEAISRGWDVEYTPRQRSFLYLPLEHAEDGISQALSLEKFEKLGEDKNLELARQHQQVFKRFGRFPSRNTVLGRQSTAEELKFLSEPDAPQW